MSLPARQAKIAATITIGFAIICSGLAEAQAALPVHGVDALAPLVGVWQSDTTDGISARSNCAWTPTRGGVLCEQDIVTPGGLRHALNLFTYSAADERYSLYVVLRPGDAVDPVPFAVEGRIWTYGGVKAAPNGQTYRTVNDFSETDSYAWRQESSADGKTWTSNVHGQSRRVH